MEWGVYCVSQNVCLDNTNKEAIRTIQIKGPFGDRRRAMSWQDTHTNSEILIQKK